MPDGVLDQISFFMGGGAGDCSRDPSVVTPEVYNVSAVEEIPTGTLICMAGFDVGRALELTVVPPSGRPSVIELPATFDQWGFSHRYPRIPGLPLGVYRLVAEQSGRTATFEFDLRHATGPRIWVDRRNDAKLGDDVNVYVGGFPANRTARLDLYGEGNPATYRTSFPIQVDEHGEGHAVIRTGAGDTGGCYGVSHPLLYEDVLRFPDAFCVFG